MSRLLSLNLRAAALRFVIALFLLLGCLQASIAAPRTIAYQGFLSTPSGAPLDGEFALTFRIYRDASGSERLWTERHSAVAVRAGLFLVALGSIEPLNNAPQLFDVGSSLYLSIEVGEDGEMTPRLPLATTPYALTSSATRASAATVDCTKGETIADALTRAPAGGTYTLNLIGTCVGNLVIERNNVVLLGNGDAKIVGVTPNPHAGNAVIYIDGARSVTLRGVTVEGAAGDATGIAGVRVDNGASGGLFDNSVVHQVNGVGVHVLDNSTWDIRGQVRDTGDLVVLVEGNSHVDFQDSVVERTGFGNIGVSFRLHSSGTMLRSTVRSSDSVAVLVDAASTLRIESDNLIESGIAASPTLAVFRGSAVRVTGSNSVIRNTNPANYTEGSTFDPAAGGLALDVEMKSTFRNFGTGMTIDGWIVAFNLSTIDIRTATINGHLDISGLKANLRLRDESGIAGRVTLNGNIKLNGGALSIRTSNEAALINGNVDCRGFHGVTGSIQFRDADDGYINCPQFASDLAVTLADSPEITNVGQTITYTAQIDNETLSPAIEAVSGNAIFSLSGAAASIIDASSSGGICIIDDPSTADCVLGRVRTGSPATVTLTVRRDATGVVNLQANVSAQNFDPDSSDNIVTEANQSP